MYNEIHEVEKTQNSGKPATYMNTESAAAYLNRSVSWILKQRSIPYLPGKPNTYKRADLDNWFERGKVRPRIIGA